MREYHKKGFASVTSKRGICRQRAKLHLMISGKISAIVPQLDETSPHLASIGLVREKAESSKGVTSRMAGYPHAQWYFVVGTIRERAEERQQGGDWQARREPNRWKNPPSRPPDMDNLRDLRRVDGSLMEIRAMQSHRPVLHQVVRAREPSIRANGVPMP